MKTAASEQAQQTGGTHTEYTSGIEVIGNTGS